MKKAVLLAMVGVVSSQLLFAQAPATSGSSRVGGVPASQPAIPAPVIPKGNGKIAGVVLDELNKKPVEFATITLLNKATDKPVDGAITDDKGKFAITKIAAGKYKVTVTFLGYETKTIEEVTIGTGKDEVNVGTFSLKPDAKALNEVSVTGEKPLVEDKVDRLVYNAEKDITNIGGTASDVLKKVPGLTVDLEGNVQLRGSGNIRVLINNKPSTVMATSIADAMRQIPADQIKTVEVITSPSAKYDAEGTAGIINIITKKNGLQGLNGNANASYGTRNSNVGGNVNYRKGKIGLTTALGHNWNNNPGENTTETRYANNSKFDQLSQEMTGRREGEFDFVQIGSDLDIDKKNNIAAGFRLQGGNFAFKTNQLSEQFLKGSPVNTFRRRNVTEFENFNYDINLDYTRLFAKPGQELTFLGLLSRNTRDNLANTDILNADDLITGMERNINDAYNEEITFQTDYVQPLPKNQMFEVGAKAILRYAESDFRFLNAPSANAAFQTINTNIFSYNQDVAAGYATYGFSLNKKYNFKVGTRYEQTKVAGDFETTGTPVKQDYGNFIPSIAVSRNLKENQTVKFNYTKRIQRPQLFFLNPYVNRMDNLNVQFGNPELDAELTNSYELSYSTYFKSGTSVNTSLYWRQTNNSIQQYTLPNAEGVNETTFDNIGRNASYGMSIFGNTKFLQKGNISGNLNVYYMDLESSTSQLNASNASMMYNANLNASYTFPKGLSAQMFGMFNSPRVTLQGKSSSWTNYNIALRKEIMNKKGSISAGIDNPFAEKLKQRNTYKAYDANDNVTTDQVSTLYVFTRQVRVSFNYQFGKMDFKSQPKRKKKISNDDAKSGGDGNQ